MEGQQQDQKLQEEAFKTDQMNQAEQISDQQNQQGCEQDLEEANYVGLSNIGATCYMNSVLQTLFMTPEFRENIYQWKYDSDDSQAEDCIPLQLQILFAKMQLRSFPYVDTKDLAKSFGWDNQDGWEQHDTQEFVRILLDAIEKSVHGSKNYNFINDIYEGTSANYVKCMECNYESITQENFLDLVVTVKNIYDKIYNDSLEKAVQRYIKPETLDNDNKYMCSKCNKKVKALRGTRFCKLPKILSFIMNRFTFDFSDMKRLKLDDYVSFPFVLNMNEYINGYDNIKNKLSEEVDPSYFKSDYTIKPPVNKTKIGLTTTKTAKISSVTTQIKKKVPIKSASNQTRDFLKNLRTQKKFQTDEAAGGINSNGSSQQGMFIEFDQNSIDKQQDAELQKAIQLSLIESQIHEKTGESKESGNNQNNSSAETADTLTDSQNHLNFNPAGPSPDPLQNKKQLCGAGVAQVVSDFQNIQMQDNVIQEEEQKCNSQIVEENFNEENEGQLTPNGKSSSLINQKGINLSNSKASSSRINRHLSNKKPSTIQQGSSNTITSSTNQGQQREHSTNKRDQEEKNKQDYKKILAEHLQKNTQDCNQLIEKYLKDGPLVYELYSILIHSGGAYGGHYYAYIKAFEDGGKWHSFNDTSIMEIDVNEIQERVFGGNSTNAYMLFYRQWEPPQRRKLKIDNLLIPKNVIDIIEVQKNKWVEEQNWKLEQSKMMSVKVHYILNVKVIQVKSTDTLSKVLDSVIQEFKIKEKRENIRLRRYKPNTDQMLDTFEELEHLSLDKLKINHFTNLCVEVKKDGEQFEEYDAGTTFVKMAVWKPNIISLDENYLDIIRVSTRRNATIYRLMEQLARAANIDFEKIVVIKKHENIHGINTAEVISTSQNYDSRLEDMGITEGQLLFIEEKQLQTSTNTLENQEHKWQEVFESDSNKIFIKFNNPIEQQQQQSKTTSNIEYNHSIIIDSRQTMQQLKEKISEQLKIDPVEVIIRRGGKAGIELKEMNKTIRSMNFINNSSIYLELGKPAKEGEIRVIFYLAIKTPLNADQILHTFEEIGELPIHGNLLASEVKVIACQFLKEKKDIDLDPNFIRLREKISDNLTRIYREKKMREQQVIEKKMIAIEQIDEPIEISLKEFLIYVRIWDQQQWTLSDRFELLVQKTDSGYDLEQKIYKQNQQIPIGQMSAMKINVWNFNLSQLLNEDWYNLDSSDVSISLHPFHIMNDGNMIIIKNKTQTPRELTDEEVKQMGIIQCKQAYKKVGVKHISQQKEKALSIKVKKKESQKDGILSCGKENSEQKESLQNAAFLQSQQQVSQQNHNKKEQNSQNEMKQNDDIQQTDNQNNPKTN
ncbi:ubiquitin carboxy-terminal hydrolase (macronuclear) [Tetrahymena thermophila SB210]|uniref:Ubiquitin carboxyl-terminal hydrolase 47 n=1 Tax=Tetrahymena thermophila (strain SB210) TaxID=312017 RepID=Q234S6_TETTS|nr:ubiquitin carboxy-terminal hydrolase [Tetrahymena thermophila SB210]EAR91927.3 ubiquitin carboxy-terminal hydrolase [Tetrahymena thermophila SB210]|eukprot:XP_001012172.3 ubiquitin carboxy-terminal hydrolase [Tetrahymena thermophila SB210]